MSAAVAIGDVGLRLGAFELRGFGCTLDAGEILVILGANGAGKSVSLEAIAGFHRLERGRIEISGRDVTRLPPEHRRVSLMFQNFGLFPHLTVAQNAAFGRDAGNARDRRWAAAPRRDPRDLLDYFRISELADRYPRDLSPGQKQRAALARAFAANPDLFLFDEPFSALDAPTHERLREELRAFLRAAHIPAIFVTHDRSDAGALADQIIVLDHGEILQSGSAAAVLSRPATARAAALLGVENILPGRYADGSHGVARVSVAGRLLRALGAPPAGGAVSVCIRAEDVAVLAPAAPPLAGTGAATANRLPGRVTALASLGPVFRLTLDCGFPLVAYLSKREMRGLELRPGSPVTAEIETEAVQILAAPGPAPAREPGVADVTQHRFRFGMTTPLPWRRRRVMASIERETR